ncbi:hypothetical protein OFC63_31550, partial [Escherichia coli]|nr:hypothetical protein [Escherichia coli]
ATDSVLGTEDCRKVYVIVFKKTVGRMAEVRKDARLIADECRTKPAENFGAAIEQNLDACADTGFSLL